jgi:hypothetical protein
MDLRSPWQLWTKTWISHDLHCPHRPRCWLFLYVREWAASVLQDYLCRLKTEKKHTHTQRSFVCVGVFKLWLLCCVDKRCTGVAESVTVVQAFHRFGGKNKKTELGKKWKSSSTGSTCIILLVSETVNWTHAHKNQESFTTHSPFRLLESTAIICELVQLQDARFWKHNLWNNISSTSADAGTRKRKVLNCSAMSRLKLLVPGLATSSEWSTGLTLLLVSGNLSCVGGLQETECYTICQFPKSRFALVNKKTCEV